MGTESKAVRRTREWRDIGRPSPVDCWSSPGPQTWFSASSRRRMAVSSGSIKLRWVSTRRLTKVSAMSLVQAGRLDAQAAALVVR